MYAIGREKAGEYIDAFLREMPAITQGVGIMYECLYQIAFIQSLTGRNAPVYGCECGWMLLPGALSDGDDDLCAICLIFSSVQDSSAVLSLCAFLFPSRWMNAKMRITSYIK